jgi:hypothetical protein
MQKKSTVKINKEPSDEILMREGNISLILDSYDDIFSDFDPRPYELKALSDDFLLECKRAAEDKQKEIELRLLIPKHKRNLNDEPKIRKRLRNHFQKHYQEKQEDKIKIRKQGILWFSLGAGLIVLSTLLYTQTYRGFLFTLLFVLSEPAGWFTIWTGLEKIFIESRKKMPHLKFYKKMSKTKINFYSY